MRKLLLAILWVLALLIWVRVISVSAEIMNKPDDGLFSLGFVGLIISSVLMVKITWTITGAEKLVQRLTDLHKGK